MWFETESAAIEAGAKVRQVARELFGVVASERATGGILITTSTFTPDAEDFARGKPLRLIAGEKLLRMVEGVRKGGASPVSRNWIRRGATPRTAAERSGARPDNRIEATP